MAFGWRAGRAQRLGARACYPLALTRSQASVATRVVLLGNAAQALHPVAGQGFNLGLRDAAALAEHLSEWAGDPGDPELLARFAAGRETDREGVVRFTDTLVRTFSDTRPLVGGLRDAGLLLFDLLPPAKQVLSRVSLGFGRNTPRLARGVPLR
jgi:2-octaprenyl-6-methoxyphenol hydroxylase